MSKNYILCREGMGEDSVFAIANYMKSDVSVLINKKDSFPKEDGSVCFRWGCTANIPTKSVVNKASAIHKVYDKPAFRGELNKHGLSPKFYGQTIPPKAELPVIVRPNKHTQGKKTFKCDTLHQVVDAIEECGEGYYISEYVPKVREFRVFVVQGRIAFICEKFPNKLSDVAWDFHPNSQWANVMWSKWPSAVMEAAVKAFALSELDFGGVDVMLDKNGKATVLEINSAAGVYGNYMARCVAKCFDYIVSNKKDPISIGSKSTSYPYLNYIHPAVADTPVYI